MAIALTTEAGVRCPSDAVTGMPTAALEMLESPDSARDGMRSVPDLTTVVQVVEGVVYVVADDHEWVLTPGDAATIPAGVGYRRWNAGEDDARWVEVYCAG